MKSIEDRNIAYKIRRKKEEAEWDKKHAPCPHCGVYIRKWGNGLRKHDCNPKKAEETRAMMNKMAGIV